jgi:hypothetical protein
MPEVLVGNERIKEIAEISFLISTEEVERVQSQ